MHIGNTMITKDIRFKPLKSEIPGPGTYEVTPTWLSPFAFQSHKFSYESRRLEELHDVDDNIYEFVPVHSSHYRAMAQHLLVFV